MENWTSEMKQNSYKHLSFHRSATSEVENVICELSSDIIMMSGNLSSKYNPHHKPSTIHTVRPSKLDFFLFMKIITSNMGENLDHECSKVKSTLLSSFQGVSL